MPQKDGFTTLQELKANPAWANIPVVVTSNLSQAQDLKRAKELGAIEYLVKSDTALGTIVDKIRRYI